ncbi:hypothetical protein [Clostridium tagluense]|uniref:ABC transporter ATP-binding protein n=1 Tax=Clostridium tagluense TaxID=360422 RepID=A0A401UL89_9CLOT|nr:hypothetical protein [Clostridium tagluense]GCD10297.1 hypothetical protein Ctaglu_19200 [Clostridium tagluense]
MEILEFNKDLKSEGTTVFISTHILSDIERICDQVSILDKVLLNFKWLESVSINENKASIYVIENYSYTIAFLIICSILFIIATIFNMNKVEVT